MRSLQGTLLVASPRLPDANFYRTVVLIIHHDKEGAFGIVLNRPMASTVQDIWESLDESPCDSSQAINSGGPVEGPLMALHTYQACSENEILPGIHFAAHKDHLNRIVREPKQEFRIFSGYSGWAPGQLEGELEHGGWMVLPARQDLIFGDPDTMWRDASHKIGKEVTDGLLGPISMPDDPSCN